MSIGFPTAPLAFRLRGAGGSAVENPQPVQRFHYPARKPVQLIPTTAMSVLRDDVTAKALNEGVKERLAGLLGIEMLELKQGMLTSRMKVQSFHGAINGYLHAASAVALADTTCGNATIAHLPKGAQGFTTVELKSNHIGTVREGELRCVATVQHFGRSTQVWDAIVTDVATGKKIAIFRCTQIILWPKEQR